MSLCRLKPLPNGLGYCPACDPHARRPIPIGARRRCYGAAADPSLWPAPVQPGVGTVLSQILKRFGIREETGCRCREYARKLDTLGPQWCRDNINEIISHLVGEAKKRRWLRYIPFKRLLARVIVLMAIKAAEKERPQHVPISVPVPVYRPNIQQEPPINLQFDLSKQNIIHIVCRSGWQDIIRRAKYALGDEFALHEVVASRDQSNAARAAEQAPPGTLICNHAFATDTKRFLELARQYQDKKFLAINHCSLNHAARWPQYFSAERQILEATRELPNLWYACPDPSSDWKRFGYDRTFWWPNPVYVPNDFIPREVDPPCVAIVGRDDWMKGFASQIMAMAIIKQTMPNVRLVAVINHVPPNWYGIELAKSCGIDLELIPWKSMDEWYRFLREDVSIILQCSMAESFNYVSIDAMLHYRPFIGSCSIRHTPPEWFADHARPETIADAALNVLKMYPLHSFVARQIGLEVAHKQNEAFSGIINSVCGK